MWGIVAAPRSLPFIVTGEPGGVSLVETIVTHRSQLRSLLVTHGSLLFRDFGVDDVAAFESAVRAMSGEPLTYHERSSPRHSIQNNIYTSTDYPPSEEIILHNESSYQVSWPRLLYFYCDREPSSRGATPLSDVRRVYHAIDPEVRREFQQRGWMLVRNYQPNLGVPWPEVYGTHDRSEVENYCAAHGMHAEWLAPDHLRTEAVRRAAHVHPDTGENVWFNHIAFFHYTSLPEDVQEGMLAMCGEDGLTTNTYYGDGGRIPADVVAHLRDCYRSESRRFDWRQGDVLVVDNMLTAHGREPFTGPRKIAVAMAEPYAPDYLAAKV